MESKTIEQLEKANDVFSKTCTECLFIMAKTEEGYRNTIRGKGVDLALGFAHVFNNDPDLVPIIKAALEAFELMAETK